MRSACSATPRGADLAFSQDGSLLAVAPRTGPVYVVDPRSAHVVRSILPATNDTAISVAFAPDGTLATGSWSGVLTLWNPRTGHRIGHPTLVSSGGANTVAFDPGGSILVTTGDAPKLWSATTQQQLGAAFPAPATTWARAAFTPDGRYLIVVTADGSAYRWPATPAAWAAHACAVAGRDFTREEWSRFVGDRRYARVCPHR